MRVIHLFVAAALSLVPAAGAIYGGTEAAEGTYPFMAHLYVGEPHEGLMCGGFLVAPTLVLTAAHCVPNEFDAALGPNLLTGGESITDYRVLLGRADLDAEGGETIAAVAAYRHPEYKPGKPHLGGVGMASNDIAIIELARASSYAPVRVATAADAALYQEGGAVARVLGWGCTPEVCFPSRLQQVDVPVWTDADCAAAPNYAVMFHAPTEVCAGDDGTDSCGGDSGGPLFVLGSGEPVVIGIVGYGAWLDTEVDPADPFGGFVPCGSGQHPGVYAEVAAHEAFLAAFL